MGKNTGNGANIAWFFYAAMGRVGDYVRGSAPRVYLKKEEATARADFSSVQGGKPKV